MGYSSALTPNSVQYQKTFFCPDQTVLLVRLIVHRPTYHVTGHLILVYHETKMT